MTGRKDVYLEALNRGNSAAWDQKWDRAAKFYRQALEEFPNDYNALVNLGMALFELQEYEEALKVYRQAEKISKENPVPTERISRIYEITGQTDRATQAAMQAAGGYLKKGDDQKAVENWLRVVQLNPNHIMARSRLALAYEKMGQKNQAVPEYLSVASLLQQGGKMEEAHQVLEHALQMSPGSQEVRQALAMIQMNQQLPEPALTQPLPPLEEPGVREIEAPKSAADDLYHLDPIKQAHKSSLTELATVLFELSEEKSDSTSSRHGFREITGGFDLSAKKKGARSKLLRSLRQAIDLQSRDQNERAIKPLEDAIRSGLETPAAYLCLGLLQSENNQPEDALRSLKHAVKHVDYALGARLLLGEVCRTQNRLKDAAAEYLEALKIADSQVVSPEHASILRQYYEPLIEAHLQEADDDDHLQLCDNVFELLVRPNWQSHLRRARQELPVHDSNFSSAPLAEILTQARSSEIVGALTGIRQYARSGHIRLAMEEAFRALDYAPTYLPLHELMGDLLLQQGQLEDAITKFSVVAKAYSSRGESTRGIELFQRIVKLAPMNLDLRNEMIDQLRVSGDVEAALEEHFVLAELFTRLADLQAARDTFADALGLAQQSNVDRIWNTKILHEMADIDLQRLDWRQAMEIYDQIRSLNPGDDKARTQLVDLYLRMGQETRSMRELDNYIMYLQAEGRPDHATTMLENMVNNYSDNINVRQRLARSYQDTGDKEKAIIELDKVGELLLAQGDQNGAAKAIQAIIELNPPNVAEYQRFLDQMSR